MSYFTPKDVKRLFPNTMLRSYAAGQIVVYQGDKPDHVFYVKKGSLKYYDIDESGNEKILHIVAEGTFFSMMYAFEAVKDIEAFYASLNEVELVLIPIKDFLKTVREDRELTQVLMRWFTREIYGMTNRIRGFEKSSAKSKVLQALDYLATGHSKRSISGYARVTFPVSQQLIADTAGLTRETVSVVMKELQTQKLVRTPKSLVLEINQSKIRKYCSN